MHDHIARIIIRSIYKASDAAELGKSYYEAAAYGAHVAAADMAREMGVVAEVEAAVAEAHRWPDYSLPESIDAILG